MTRPTGRPLSGDAISAIAHGSCGNLAEWHRRHIGDAVGYPVLYRAMRGGSVSDEAKRKIEAAARAAGLLQGRAGSLTYATSVAKAYAERVQRLRSAVTEGDVVAKEAAIGDLLSWWETTRSIFGQGA